MLLDYIESTLLAYFFYIHIFVHFCNYTLYKKEMRQKIVNAFHCRYFFFSSKRALSERSDSTE